MAEYDNKPFEITKAGDFATGFCLTKRLHAPIDVYRKITGWLNRQAAQWPPLLLRIILAYEFWEADLMKYNGENWFENLSFPFPFSLFSDNTLWIMGTWIELFGALALFLGFGTRIAVLSLMVLTVIAIETVHWPTGWNSLSELWQGYAITNNGHGNFKLPLLYNNSHLEFKKGVGCVWRGCRQQGCCRQAPTDGFTAFLDRHTPCPKYRENVQTGNCCLLYLIMFLPLLFGGGGHWSLDHVLSRQFQKI